MFMRAEIARTYDVIRPYIRRTPVVDVDAADFGLDPMPLVLKLELMQHTGSFKTRGAFSNLLTRAVPAAGVVAASGGNHGVAVAYAAMKAGKAARIFVPTVSSPAKMERIRSYGAELVVTGERYNDALLASQEWAGQSGAMAVHAYDQMETLWGAGSVGLEFTEQAPGLDTLLVACGGGGLIGGIAGWCQGRVRIIGVEPEKAPTLYRALAGGASGGCRGGRDRSGFAGSETGGRVDVPAGAALGRSRWRWSPMTRSWMRRGRCGIRCAWWRNRAARRHSVRCYRGPTGRRRESASECWCAGRIRRRWIWGNKTGVSRKGAKIAKKKKSESSLRTWRLCEKRLLTGPKSIWRSPPALAAGVWRRCPNRANSGNLFHDVFRHRPASALRQNREVFVIFQPLPDLLQPD